jgi:hypothetical protein
MTDDYRERFARDFVAVINQLCDYEILPQDLVGLDDERVVRYMLDMVLLQRRIHEEAVTQLTTPTKQ